MSSKTQVRLKMTMYVLVLVLAELLQTAVFGGLSLGIAPSVMPVAVVCISMFEGAERGSIFGLVGGCLWAWSTDLSYYGAWCIVILTVTGALVGLVTERFLLRGIQTALCMSLPALILTAGLRLLTAVVSGRVPASAYLTVFLPETLIALVLCLLFYPLTSRIYRIGGTHG